MNISPLTIYLWQLADSIRDLFQIGAVIIGVILATGTFASFITSGDILPDSEEHIKKLLKAVKVAICLFFVFIFTATFIPTSKTIAMMVVIPKIAESKVIQQDLPDLYDFAIKSLKEQLAPKDTKK